MNENDIAKIIVDRSLRVHRTLGPGLLESVYEEALSYELNQAGLGIERQVSLPVIYNGIRMDLGFRIDIRVNKKLIIEIKSVEEIAPVHHKQILTYLRLTELKLGLLINFNVNLIKDGIQRVVNNLSE